MRRRTLPLVATFMIYLVLSIVIMKDVAAGALVTKSTGDLSFSSPLITVPGTGGMSFPIVFSYSGSGVFMDQAASWVGLGFSLEPGSITRTVMGIPDDATNDMNNVWVKSWWDTSDDRSWFQKFYEDWLLIVVLIVIAILTAIFLSWIDAGATTSFLVSLIVAVLSSITMQLYYVGTVDWGEVGMTALITTATFGLANIENIKMLSFLAEHAETIKRLQSFVGCAAAAYSAYKAISSMAGAKESGGGDDEFDRLLSQNGFLRSPTYQEQYFASNYPLHDGGSPDSWSVSGPVSGKMVIAHQTTHGRITGIGDAKFFLEQSHSPEAVDISYDLDGDGHIISFVVTDSGGTRYVYGDGIDSALVWSFSSGSYSYSKNVQGAYTYESKNMNFYFEPHVSEWKLTAILNPDYIDGDGNLNPLDSEATNKGSWIAFTYNKVYYYSASSPNCGFNLGNSMDGDFVWVSEHSGSEGTRIKTGGVTELSYLSSIKTPTHIAEFDIVQRLDGKEKDSSWVYDTSKGPHGFNFDQGTFCQTNNNGCASSSKYCSGNAGSSNYPYRLTKITLRSRSDGLALGAVKFNSGISTSGMYTLKQGTPGNSPGSNPDAGVYTLNHFDICDKNEVNCKRAEFYY